jgi:hypothetical protein
LLILREGTDKRRLHALLDRLGDSPSTSALQLALERPNARPNVRGYLVSGEPQDRYNAILAVRFLVARDFDTELWNNASYFEDAHYPGDVHIRTASLSTLLHARLGHAFDPAMTDGELAELPSDLRPDHTLAPPTAGATYPVNAAEGDGARPPVAPQADGGPEPAGPDVSTSLPSAALREDAPGADDDPYGIDEFLLDGHPEPMDPSEQGPDEPAGDEPAGDLSSSKAEAGDLDRHLR